MKAHTTWRAEPIKKDTDLSKVTLVTKKCENKKCCQRWKATKTDESTYCSHYCANDAGAKTARWSRGL